MFTFSSPVEPISVPEMFGRIGQTHPPQRGYKAGVGVPRKGQRRSWTTEKYIQSDCLKNIQRCPSTTFIKKFNKKTGL